MQKETAAYYCHGGRPKLVGRVESNGEFMYVGLVWGSTIGMWEVMMILIAASCKRLEGRREKDGL